MQKLKDILLIGVIIIFIGLTITSIGFVKYKIWRAEHPEAKTWTFFIPEKH